MEWLMPDSNGFEKLGNLLGGGMGQVREQAYQEGKLRTAQTENALANARENQLKATAEETKAKAREKFEETYVATGGDPQQAQLLGNLIAGESGSDFKAGMEGQQVGQETHFRETLGNPNAPLADQFAAGQGVQGKMLNRREMMGAGDFMDITNPEAPLQSTPLGASMISENAGSESASRALASLRGEQQTHPERFHDWSVGGVKPPTGFKLNPNYDPEQPEEGDNTQLVPITGGPQDPNTPGKLGSREVQVLQRVITAARNTVSDLQNIMALPSGASLGVFGTGVGGSPGASLMDATVDTLKNTVADEEVRDYNAMLGGFTTQLSTMERQGLNGSGALAQQYETLLLRPEDTVLNKMRKLALVRQTVENSLEPHLYSNRLPPSLKAYVGNLITSVKQAVPFTPRDVSLLGIEKEGSRLTIADILNQAGAKVPLDKAGLPVEVVPAEVGAPGGAAPAAGAPSMEDMIVERGLGTKDAQGQIKDDRGWTLMHDADGNYAWVSADGKEFEEVAQ
jgi:broad specificity phosphatase PhoE